jgi:hypothetical protein
MLGHCNMRKAGTKHPLPHIDERAHIFTYHVEGAVVRTLIGKDLKRVYQFSGNQLIVKSPSDAEHWRVAWEHY